jgi:hypothetical protein
MILMKHSVIVLVVCCAVFNWHCTTKKEARAAQPEHKKQEEMMINEGYIKAKVIDLKGKDGCEILLENLLNKELLNPISWPEEVAYKKPGTLVYVKYRESRIQQSTCFSSKPVMLDEIKIIK